MGAPIIRPTPLATIYRFDAGWEHLQPLDAKESNSPLPLERNPESLYFRLMSLEGVSDVDYINQISPHGVCMTIEADVDTPKLREKIIGIIRDRIEWGTQP